MGLKDAEPRRGEGVRSLLARRVAMQSAKAMSCRGQDGKVNGLSVGAIGSVECRHHLLTEQPESRHDVLVRNLATAIQFHQDPVEA
jgi:hypothetical protein